MNYRDTTTSIEKGHQVRFRAGRAKNDSEGTVVGFDHPFVWVERGENDVVKVRPGTLRKV